MSKQFSRIPKIKIYDTAWQKGAMVDEAAYKDLPVVSINLEEIIGLEPDQKMKASESSQRVGEMIQLIRESENSLPPILVRQYGDGYQIIDGHHRLYAYRQLHKSKMLVKVVPQERIQVIEKEPQWRIPYLYMRKILKSLGRKIKIILAKQ